MLKIEQGKKKEKNIRIIESITTICDFQITNMNNATTGI